jgi:hypothetical protein
MAEAIPFGKVGIDLQIVNGICRNQYPFADRKCFGLNLKLKLGP